MQCGFGFNYKGWGNSIKATAILKQEMPDVFFTGLFSESPFNKVGHRTYYDELMQLVEQLGVQDNVAIIRGYQSDDALDSYMRTNRAVIFPYVSSPEHEVFGASGAARLAMSKGVPVVTTSVNHFSDLPTIKANTPEEMAQALKRMFQNDLAWKEQVDRQLAYVAEHTWEKVALLYVEALTS
jgi:glycosyltransferase involved in cell wall biosynthesis